jgi:excisionase family DNA binding protein
MENKITMLGIGKDELKELMKEALNELLDSKMESKSETKEFLTIEEVCELMSISRQTLYKKRKTGEINAYQVIKRGKVLFRSEDIRKLFI